MMGMLEGSQAGLWR